MITDFLLGIVPAVVGWLAGIFPAWDPPSWMADTPVMLNRLLQDYTGLGVWVDWTALGVCISAVVGVYVVGSVIRLARAVVSYVPEFGGGG